MRVYSRLEKFMLVNNEFINIERIESHGLKNGPYKKAVGIEYEYILNDNDSVIKYGTLEDLKTLAMTECGLKFNPFRLNSYTPSILDARTYPLLAMAMILEKSYKDTSNWLVDGLGVRVNFIRRQKRKKSNQHLTRVPRHSLGGYIIHYTNGSFIMKELPNESRTNKDNTIIPGGRCIEYEYSKLMKIKDSL